ncbi:hypothetical protein LINPERPRIM_LOCUS32004 [Linum perenne]
MDHHIPPSSFSHILGAAVLILLVGPVFQGTIVTGEMCTGSPPDDPVKYNSWVRKVLNKLVKKTPTSSTNMFKAYYPKKKVGPVTGAATCYTADEDTCRTCLRDLRRQLEQCVNTTAGGTYGNECNMEFWEVGSV